MTTPQILVSGIRNARNVARYMFSRGVVAELPSLVDARRTKRGYAVFLIDHYFRHDHARPWSAAIRDRDEVIYVDTSDEPKTSDIDRLRDALFERRDGQLPDVVTGIGGGATLDTAKALSNLLGNGGRAEQYQGWDLLTLPGVFKIGVPTLSGTGAESTRTCVLTNPANGLKLGMNSDFTVFDQLVLDPDLTETVPREQYFYTGMDAYVHCIESLAGTYRNAIGDAFSAQTLVLCRDVFLSPEMKTAQNRERLMVASYLGGCAIANSYVGVVHPFSAGLSVVLGLHHGIGNCIALQALAEFYPEQADEFGRMAECQGVEIPSGVCAGLDDDQFEALYQATIVHEKPLTNALGEDFLAVLTRERVRELFERM